MGARRGREEGRLDVKCYSYQKEINKQEEPVGNRYTCFSLRNFTYDFVAQFTEYKYFPVYSKSFKLIKKGKKKENLQISSERGKPLKTMKKIHESCLKQRRFKMFQKYKSI